MAAKDLPSTPPPAPLVTPDFKELVRIARESAGVSVVEVQAPSDAAGVPTALQIGVKHGATPELLDLHRYFESWRTRPRRRLGTAKTLTLQSFIDLVNYHKLDRSAVFADTNWQAPGFTAVIDYHAGPQGDPSFGQHRVAYQFPLSLEWQVWREQDGSKMSQADFAAFIEDRIPDLASPTEAEVIALERDFQTKVATPAELMQLARGLQVNIEARVKNIVTLQSGEGQIAWEEAHKDADGRPLKVPGLFMLSIAPFFMGEKVRVPVRLRYRASGGSIVWAFQIYRADQFVTERVRTDLDIVSQKTGLPVYEGHPEAGSA